MTNRYQDPETGRFISRDPYTWGPDDERVFSMPVELREAKGIAIAKGGAIKPLYSNLYIYSLNNPIKFSDPAGKMCGPGGLPDWVNPISDFPSGCDFSAACTYHDRCYEGIGNIERYDCDNTFHSMMLSECNNHKRDLYKYKKCISSAEDYFWAVRTFGDKYYKGRGWND